MGTTTRRTSGFIQLSALAALTADALASRAAERRVEEELAMSLRAASLGRWTIDFVSGRRWWDARLLELPRTRRGPATSEATRAVIHPDDIPVIEAAMQAAMDPAGSGDVDVFYRTIGAKTGVQRTIRAVGRANFVDGRCVRLSGVAEDISARIAAEADRRLREQAFRLAVEAADIGMWDLETSTNVLTWSPRCRQIFGVGPAQTITLDDFYAFIHDDDRESVRIAFTACLDPERRADYAAEYRIVRRDGVNPLGGCARAWLFANDGRCERAIGTVIDITERKAWRCRRGWWRRRCITGSRTRSRWPRPWLARPFATHPISPPPNRR